MLRINKLINQFTSYVDASKFKDADSLLTIYKSTEGRSIKTFNGLYLAMLGYNVYSYYQDQRHLMAATDDLAVASYRSSVQNSQIIIFAISIGMALFYFKTSRTLKTLLLEQNGRTVYMETYSVFGFNSKLKQRDIQTFRGFYYYLHPSFRIPTFRTDDNHAVFFKHQYVVDEQTMKDVMLGRIIQVRPKDMQKEVSQNQKKKYGL